MNQQELLKLVMEYMMLSYTASIRVASELGVFNQDDYDLPPRKLFKTIIDRVKDKNLLHELAEKLRAEKDRMKL